MSWSPLCLLIRRHGDKEFLWEDTPLISALKPHRFFALRFSSCLTTAFFLVTEAVQSHCSSTECWKVSHRYRMLSLLRFLVLILDILNILSHFQQRDAKREYIPNIKVLENRSVLVLFTVCKAAQFCMINSVCGGEELHLSLVLWRKWWIIFVL